MRITKYFSEKSFNDKYGLYKRSKLYDSYLKPTVSNKYFYKPSKDKLLKHIIDKELSHLKLYREFNPNYELHFKFPTGFLTKDVFINYNLKLDDKTYTNFLYYKYQILNENKTINQLDTADIGEYHKFTDDIEKGIISRFYNSNNYKFGFEIPTRLTGDTSNNNNSIICEMLLMYYDYELELDIYTKDDVKDKLNEIKVIRKDIAEDEEFELELDGDVVENGQKDIEMKLDTLNITEYLNKLKEILTRDEDITLGLKKIDKTAEKDYNIYEYKEGGLYISTKLELVVKTILYYLNQKLEETKTNTEKINTAKETKMYKILSLYFDVQIAYSDYEDFLKLEKRIKVTEAEKKKEANQKEYLALFKDNGKKLSDKCKGLFDISSITNIKKYIENMENDIKTKPSNLKLHHYTIKYTLNLSDKASLTEAEIAEKQKKKKEEDEKKDLLELKTFNYPNYVISLIQKDLKEVLSKRHTPAEIEQYLANETKIVLEGIKNNVEKGDKQSKYTQSIIVTMLDAIKTGDIRVFNLLLKDDEYKKMNRYTSITDLITKLKDIITHHANGPADEIANGPADGSAEGSVDEFVGGLTIDDYKKNYKKNMNDIYNRLQDYKMKNLNNNIENFIGGPHQHTPYGQVNQLSVDEFSKSKFDNPEWLQDPKNTRLLQNYKFLTDGTKKGILSEMDNMEKQLYTLKGYAEDKYVDIKDKLDLIDAQAQEELRKQQEESEMTDLEKSMRDFQVKEKEQEDVMKRMNQKISDLEKEQKGINLAHLDQVNTIRSLGDGQMLSVQNMKGNNYQILGNKGCISNKKVKGKDILEVDSCGNKSNQNFNFHHIANTDEYNKHLKKQVLDEDSVVYPFHIITPQGSGKKCVSVRGNKMAVTDCEDSKYHKFETLKSFKDCDSKYGN